MASRATGLQLDKPLRRLAHRLPLIWTLLLLLPALTSFSSLEAWDLDPEALFLASVWLIGAGLLLLPAGLFYALSLPLALFGLVAAYSHAFRQVDVLELLLQWEQFKVTETVAVLQPYALELLIAPLLLGGLAFSCWRWGWRPRRRPYLIWTAVGLLLALWAPAAVWVRAWPANLLAIPLSQLPGGHWIQGDWLPFDFKQNPRGEGRTWNARRLVPGPTRETYVLVIGESLRADYLAECGDRWSVRPLHRDALVACDVTAGSSATHTSVPLLVGRTAPGHRFRVPRDSSFVRAFGELGFDTHWYSQHSRPVAWPDAAHQAYLNATGRDRALLLPLLEQALRGPALRKLIVLHAENAHAPYCNKFLASEAPHPVDCRPLDALLPSGETLQQFRYAYANAVDESVAFLNEVIGRLQREEGEVFMAYTPDHGENLLDDSRQLFQHALRFPTRWDIQVPMVFWANPAWRESQPDAWTRLAAARSAPLMHADLVPTLMSAARIGYQESRRGVFRLTQDAVPAQRQRLVQKSLGATTDWEHLVEAARP